MSLEITTNIGCSLACKFCPQSTLVSAYGNKECSLSFAKFAQYLSKIPKHVHIHFSGFSEPWLNAECTKMLKLSLESGYKVNISTTLYGMKTEEADEVISLLNKYADKITGVMLHLPDKNNYMRGWRFSPTYVNVFSKFFNFHKTKILSNFKMMTMDGNGEIHDSLKEFNLRLPKWKALTRANNIEANSLTENEQKLIKSCRHTMPLICYSPFYDRNVLLPNGDIALCCMDYGLSNILGNLNFDEYYDLFASNTLAKIINKNMQPAHDAVLCKSCSYATLLDTNDAGMWQISGGRNNLIPMVTAWYSPIKRTVKPIYKFLLRQIHRFGTLFALSLLNSLLNPLLTPLKSYIAIAAKAALAVCQGCFLSFPGMRRSSFPLCKM